MRAVTEPPTTPDRPVPLSSAVRLNDWISTPHRRKETLLPQIVQLALEGHSSEAIARKVDVPGRTVRYWLRESRQQWIAASAGGVAEMLAVTMARLTEIYREAMEGWRDSRADVETRLVEDTQVSDGSHAAKQKRAVRTQPPRRNAAILTRATVAAKAMFDLKLRALATLSKEKAAAPSGPPPTPLDKLTQEDLSNMTDEELRAVTARCKAELVLAGKPIPPAPPELTEEELDRMSYDELRAEAARCAAEIEAQDRSLPLGTLTAKDLETVSDDELRAVLAKGLAEREAAARPPSRDALKEEDLKRLTNDEVRAVVTLCLAPDEAIDAADLPPGDDDSPPRDNDSPPRDKDPLSAAGDLSPSPFSPPEECVPVPQPSHGTPDSCRPSAFDVDHTHRSTTPCLSRVSPRSCGSDTRPLENGRTPCGVENDPETCRGTDFRQVPAITHPSEGVGSGDQGSDDGG